MYKSTSICTKAENFSLQRNLVDQQRDIISFVFDKLDIHPIVCIHPWYKSDKKGSMKIYLFNYFLSVRETLLLSYFSKLIFDVVSCPFPPSFSRSFKEFLPYALCYK